MTPAPWYTAIYYYYYRVLAWLPVVHRRGTWWDLNDRLAASVDFAEYALDALEHKAEDGLHEARAALYATLSLR